MRSSFCGKRTYSHAHDVTPPRLYGHPKEPVGSLGKFPPKPLLLKELEGKSPGLAFAAQDASTSKSKTRRSGSSLLLSNSALSLSTWEARRQVRSASSRLLP